MHKANGDLSIIDNKFRYELISLTSDKQIKLISCGENHSIIYQLIFIFKLYFIF